MIKQIVEQCQASDITFINDMLSNGWIVKAMVNSEQDLMNNPMVMIIFEKEECELFDEPGKQI